MPKVPVNIPVPQEVKAKLVYTREELFNILNGSLKRSTTRPIYQLDLNRNFSLLRNIRGVTYANLVKIPVERTCRARMNVQSLTICSVNAQSCRNKTNAIRDYIVENDIDVFAITEFAEYLETTLAVPDQLLFGDLLTSSGLQQHVHEVTHALGHTLNLVITRMDDNTLIKEPVTDFWLSDHASVTFKIRTTFNKPVVKEVVTRNIKGISIELFKNEVFHKLQDIDVSTDVHLMVERYIQT